MNTEYVIRKNKQGEITLERITEEKVMNGILHSVTYRTLDYKDEELKSFESLIWNRIYNPVSSHYERVIIPFTPDDYELMKKNAQIQNEILFKKIKNYADTVFAERNERKERRRIERKEKVLNDPELQAIMKENEELFPMDMPESEAIQKWLEMDCRMPPAKRIKQIKDFYKLSWNEFKQKVKSEY